MGRKSSITIVAVLLSLPLFLVWSWHVKNGAYPRADAADFFLETQHKYNFLKYDGLWAGFLKLYLNRSWKQILHPLIGVLFLALSGGSVLGAIKLFDVLVYGIFIYFLFKVLRCYLDMGRSVLGTLVISTAPWILSQHFSFMAESPLMAAFAAGAFYFHSSQCFSKTRDGVLFGVSAGLAYCIRPAETVMILIPITVFFAFNSNFRASIKRAEFLVCMSLFLFDSVLLLTSCFLRREFSMSESIEIFLLIEAIFLIGYLYRQWLGLSKGIFSPVVASCTVILVWFLPVLFDLGVWVNACLFGPLALNQFKFSYWDKIFDLYNGDMGGMPLLVTLALGFAGTIGAKFSLNRRFILFAMLLGFVPMIIAPFTSNTDNRYFQTLGVVFYATLVIMAITENGFLPRMRVGLALVLVAGQIIFLVSFIYGALVMPDPKWAKIFNGSSYRFTLFRNPGPIVQVMSQLKLIMASNSSNRITILNLHQGNDEFDLNFGSFPVLANEQGLPLNFVYNYEPKQSSEDIVLKHVKAKVDFILTGPISGDDQLGWPLDIANAKLGMSLVSAWQNGRLAEKGLELVREIKYMSRENRFHSLLLLKKCM